MIYLVSWAEDPEMKKRGEMMLDWLFAGLAANTLNGLLRGANSRADDMIGRGAMVWLRLSVRLVELQRLATEEKLWRVCLPIRLSGGRYEPGT